MLWFGVQMPIWRQAASAIGPSGQCGATATVVLISGIVVVGVVVNAAYHRMSLPWRLFV